ncbi:P-loop containing nucleoside triphosphate hydrolase protein [Microdochium bolleyi]|uniref:Cell division control protein n=1 Tax=Microdochium bolleyi TaxID=196109 RepID=A0A136JFP3_9PEZI|nr:P-loop containing nucleoside triphosphate hydrolase protein [Microdochium bolleyi]
MATAVLGKRTRSSLAVKDLQPLPATKRSKRISRASMINDENIDPIREEAAESTDETSCSEITEDASCTTTRATTPYTPVTPSTSRFRDVLVKVPVTPRHRVISSSRIIKRQTPQTPSTPSGIQTVYSQARLLFSRSSDPGQMIGRDDERGQLQAFLNRCAEPNPSGCIYVSGPPGTGKSAMVNEMTNTVVAGTSAKKVYINCMSIKSSKDLYETLLEQITADGAADVSDSDAAIALQKLIMPRQKSTDVFLVVLDEIDHILTLDLESLYRLFEWSMQKTSRLALVGIANALDLTDRFLPRLKSRNLKPELLPFLPYTAPQIKNIITKRLASLVPQGSPLPFIHPAAVELCSRKVSSQTGDLRKAFEICRRAIDLIESETKQKHEAEARETMLLATPSRKVLGENPNASSPSKRESSQSVSSLMTASLKSLTIETAPRVSIAHLNKITAAAFSNGTSQRLKNLNLQQKAALCSLVALEKRNRAARPSSVVTTPSKNQSAAPSIKTLYDTYCLLCRQDSVLHPLSSSEFREVMGSLETLSLVAAVDGKTGSLALQQTPSKRGRKSFASSAGLADDKKVASCVGDADMEQAVEGLGADILRSILSGEALE